MEPAQHPGFSNQAHSHALRFRHICQSSACPSPSCSLCKNNPNKRCADNCNFGSVYVQGNKIKAKCGSEIFVELLSKATGQAQMLSDVKLQLSVIDGSPRHSAKMGLQGSLLDHAKELLISDQAGCCSCCRVSDERLLLPHFPLSWHLQFQQNPCQHSHVFANNIAGSAAASRKPGAV